MKILISAACIFTLGSQLKALDLPSVNASDVRAISAETVMPPAAAPAVVSSQDHSDPGIAAKISVIRLGTGAEKSSLGGNTAVITPGCHQPIVYIKGGDIYRDNFLLGRNAVDFKTACSGDVAWTGNGKIYKNTGMIGRDPVEYKMASGNGDIVWVQDGGKLFKNTLHLGDGPVSFEVAALTGDVAWVNAGGDVYKNISRLGHEAVDFGIADMTGDVAWTDSKGSLYKNYGVIAHGASGVQLYPDGRLLWNDENGGYHIR